MVKNDVHQARSIQKGSEALTALTPFRWGGASKARTTLANLFTMFRMPKMTARTIHRAKSKTSTEWLDEFRRHSPEWAAQLATARTKQELKSIVSHLAMKLVEQIATSKHAQDTLQDQIRTFMATNLHRGLTLKDLSVFLGYSEKYCSTFFLSIMGEPFSQSLKHLRVQKTKRLLEESSMSMAQIAQSLGFSDQFAFSHFFKKAIGCSPRQFRDRTRKLTSQQRSRQTGNTLDTG